MTSALMQRLGVMLPIVQGPMTGSDSPELAATVSAGGGLGSLGCKSRSNLATLSPTALASTTARKI